MTWVLGLLTSGFAWGKDNFKWIAIALLAIVIAFGAWRYTKLVENYAQAQYTIEQQEQIIKDKEKALQLERDINTIAISALEQQAKEMAELESQLKDITNNLGDDAGNLAPDSIRELLKRLGIL